MLIEAQALYVQLGRLAESMPQFMVPRKGRYALRDYEKMFCSDQRGNADIFDMRGIDGERGCAVVVRPDQYIADVLPLEAFHELSAFFDAFMLEAD